MIYCVRVRSTGKQALYQTEDTEFRAGDTVIIEVETGLDTARILYRRQEDEAPSEGVGSIKRRATEDDLKQLCENQRMEAEGRIFCVDRIRVRDLPMKLVTTCVTFDRKKFSFYFTAEKRVDFRELVKDLASRFRTRIELRQIGIRDEAKMVGGLGSCGREVCCRLFLTQFAPISIKMAKGQDIALNPTKISGLCGRLMCCLNYEHGANGKKERRREAVALVDTSPMEEMEESLQDLSPQEEGTVEPPPSAHAVQAGSAEEGGQDTPAGEKPSGDQAGQPERKGRRRKRRNRQAQKPQAGPTPTGEPVTASVTAVQGSSPAPPSADGSPQTGERPPAAPGRGRRSRRRRKNKPKQES